MLLNLQKYYDLPFLRLTLLVVRTKSGSEAEAVQLPMPLTSNHVVPVSTAVNMPHVADSDHAPWTLERVLTEFLHNS